MSSEGGWNFEPSLPVELGDGPSFLDQPYFAIYHDTAMNIFYVSIAMIVIVWLLVRKIGKTAKPGRAQMIAELLVDTFDTLCKQVSGARTGRLILPLIGTLFLFVWGSNMIGLVKIDALTAGLVFDSVDGALVVGADEITDDINGNGLYEPYMGDKANLSANGSFNEGFPIPAFAEPTKNLNVPLGLALLFFIITLSTQIRRHGFLAPIKELFSPFFVMFPLNCIGKLAEVASISFRLFGNIFGGVVIAIVVAGLIHELVLPIGLDLFFGVFVGTVQAFVFTMLSLTYFTMTVGPDEDESAAEGGATVD
ncbi:MAG: F0F1 ATP synthase subunit A [Planctomycetota bacterium]